MKIVFRHLILIGAAVSALLLTGCASTFAGKVTITNNLPTSSIEKTFRFDAKPEIAEIPEVAHTMDMVRDRLLELGFVEPNDTQSTTNNAALAVQIQLNTTPGDIHVSMPFGPMNFIITPYGTVIPLNTGYRPYPSYIRYSRAGLYRPFYFSPFYSPFSSWYSPFNFGRRFDPIYGPPMNVRQQFTHEVTITFIEVKTGKPVYVVNANTRDSSADIFEQLFYLVESALKDFPGKTGTENVHFEIGK
jgi:hypothetical protein